MNPTQKNIIIFTDGSSLGNPGPGGWGAVIVASSTEEVVELGGSKPHTTNNEMELEAAVAALAYTLNTADSITIHTDSQYLINGVTKWMFNWEKNGWKTKTGTEVKNRRQWELLAQFIQMKKGMIEWIHLPSHVGIPGNERADEIAQKFAQGENPQLFRGKLSDYSIQNIAEIPHIEERKELGEGKRRQRGKAYAYLSLVDGVVEQHKDWASCEARVKGKKARYRKVFSEEEARELEKEWLEEKHKN